MKEHPNLSQYKDNVTMLLKHSAIPDRKWSTNDLNQKLEINEKEHADIKAKYSNLYELLVEYNNNDVLPTVEATKKLLKFFKDIKLDMHKDGISIPGLTLKYMWKLKESESKFQLFKDKEELYHKYKDNLVSCLVTIRRRTTHASEEASYARKSLDSMPTLFTWRKYAVW
jgi:hypothetical protein